MSDKFLSTLPSGSISDSSIGLVGNPINGALSQSTYLGMKGYFQQGLSFNTSSLLTTASFNTFSSSYVTDSASFNNRINSNTGSSISASNGLNFVSGTIGLGGTLSSDTLISGSFNLEFGNTVSVRQTITGSDSTNSVSILPVWNTSGSPTALLLKVQNTSSSINSRFLDCELTDGVHSVTLFNVDLSGILYTSKAIGIGANSSAKLTIASSDGSANTAPIKLSPGSTLITPEDGTIEYDGTYLYFTSGSVRTPLNNTTGNSFTASNGLTFISGTLSIGQDLSDTSLDSIISSYRKIPMTGSGLFYFVDDGNANHILFNPSSFQMVTGDGTQRIDLYTQPGGTYLGIQDQLTNNAIIGLNTGVGGLEIKSDSTGSSVHDGHSIGIFMDNSSLELIIGDIEITGSGVSVNVASTRRGMAIPKLSGSAITAISTPSISELLYNTDNNTVRYYNSSSWKEFLTTFANSSPNAIPYFSDSSTLSNSLLFQTGSGIRLSTGSLTINSGSLIINTGSIYLPFFPSSSISSSFIYLGGTPFIHTYSPQDGFSSTYMGIGTGNTSRSTNGLYNVGIGNGALGRITGSLIGTYTGSFNVAVGYSASQNLTTGNQNVTIGAQAGQFLTTGSNNILIGSNAGSKIIAGSSNILIGSGPFSGNNSNSTFNFNTIVGVGGLNNISSGSGNIALGSSAGSGLTTGSNNTIIGSVGFNNLAANAFVKNFTLIANQDTNLFTNNYTSGSNIFLFGIDQNVLINRTFDNGNRFQVSGSSSFLGDITNTVGSLSTNQLIGNSIIPTIVVGGGGGVATGGTASITGSNIGGIINLNTGTVPLTATNIVTITYGNSFSFPVGSFVTFSPGNTLTATLTGASGVFISSSTTNFTLNSGATGLGVSSAYIWYYTVIGL